MTDAANFRQRSVWVLKVLILPLIFIRNEGFQPYILHFWAKMFRQKRRFWTILLQPKICSPAFVSFGHEAAELTCVYVAHAASGAEQCDGDETAGARWSGSSQPQVADHTATRLWRRVPLIRLHSARLLPRPQPAGSQELALLRQVQDGAPQLKGTGLTTRCLKNWATFTFWLTPWTVGRF